MDILERLRDPWLVADFQHYFGIRRNPEVGKVYVATDKNEMTGVEKSDCTFMDWYLQDQTAQGLHARTSKLSVPQAECKTHVRQGSAASDSSVERGKPNFIVNCIL